MAFRATRPLRKGPGLTCDIHGTSDAEAVLPKNSNRYRRRAVRLGKIYKSWRPG